MPKRICPACRQDLEGNVTSSGLCALCGHDLAATAAVPPWVMNKVDLRAAARHHRHMLIALLILLASLVPSFFTAFAAPRSASAIPYFAIGGWIVALGAWLSVIICAAQLMSALRWNTFVIVVCVVCMLVGCVNLIIMLIISISAGAQFRAAGLRVGFMGVRDADVTRLLGTNRCRNCGYMLIGNTTGRCPECGAPSDTAGYVGTF